jgi:hypothetical protein
VVIGSEAKYHRVTDYKEQREKELTSETIRVKTNWTVQPSHLGKPHSGRLKKKLTPRATRTTLTPMKNGERPKLQIARHCVLDTPMSPADPFGPMGLLPLVRTLFV